MADETTIRKLREDDLDALYRIRQIAFLDNVSRSNPQVQEIHRALLPYKYGRFVDGKLVSSASWYPFSMYLGGEPRTVGGLASVVSAVESRRQGNVSALLVHGLEMLRDEGVSWCLEYPFDTRYYRRFGWETVSNGFFFELPIERFARFGGPDDVSRIDVEDASVERIRRVYGSWASNYTFTMARDEKVRRDWTRVLRGAPWEQSQPRFVFATEQAYLIVQINNIAGAEKLTVRDYAFESPKGREEIFGFLNNFAGQVATVRLQLPAGDPLVMEWSNFMVAHPHPLHARVVDVVGALSGWSVDEDVELTVAVSDDVCAWNDGVFRVEAEDGVTRAARADAPADLAVDVRGLAQILSGSVTPRAARLAGLVDAGLVDAGQQAVDQLCGLNSRPCYMPLADYF